MPPAGIRLRFLHLVADHLDLLAHGTHRLQRSLGCMNGSPCKQKADQNQRGPNNSSEEAFDAVLQIESFLPCADVGVQKKIARLEKRGQEQPAQQKQSGRVNRVTKKTQFHVEQSCIETAEIIRDPQNEGTEQMQLQSDEQ